MTTPTAVLVKWQLLQVLLQTLVQTANALNLKPNISSKGLKHPDGVTFDPLGVAAILHNPRAEKSAARLYTKTEHDKHLFRWPHTTMFGGVLIPLKTLAEHLTPEVSSVPPALTLGLRDTTKIDIQSQDMVFKELLFTFNDVWLLDAIRFKPSKFPQNDIVIVLLDEHDLADHELDGKSWSRKLLIDATALVNGLILVAGVFFSVIDGDMWAVVLFVLYGSHWLVSTLISCFKMVTYITPTIAGSTDKKDRYAVYEREEGGMIVFKGRKICFEKLARSRWKYVRTTKKDILHWAWMISGTLSAVSSIACMVNMAAHLQLIFLGALSYSSLAEIWVTNFARSAQRKASKKKEGQKIHKLQLKEKRAVSMIWATLAIEDKFRLHEIDWVGLKLLPNGFRALQTLLHDLNANEQTPFDPYEKYRRDFKADAQSEMGLGERDAQYLVDSMENEVIKAIKERGPSWEKGPEYEA